MDSNEKQDKVIGAVNGTGVNWDILAFQETKLKHGFSVEGYRHLATLKKQYGGVWTGVKGDRYLVKSIKAIGTNITW